MDKCIVCGSESIPILQEHQLNLLEDWNSSCADSLSKTFGVHINDLVENYSYCIDCFQITSDIDFLVRSINLLEIKLKIAEDEIKKRIQMDSTTPIAIAISTNSSTTPMDLHIKRQMLRELRQQQKVCTTEQNSFVPLGLDTDRQSENESHQLKEESKDFDFEENDWNDDFNAHSLVEIQLGKSVNGEDSFKTSKTPEEKPVLPSKTKSNTFKRKRKQNKGAKVFQCKEAGCTFECSKISLYIAHKASLHGGGRPGRKKTRIRQKRCQFCFITFDDNDEELLQDHEEKHRDSDIPRCVINDCGVEFITLGSLKAHVRKIHKQPETPVSCEVCGKLCSSNGSLNQHRFAMHPAKHRKELKCPDCNYTTFVPTRLAGHQIIHSNERPYSCNQCDATYKRRKQLKRHEYIHMNVKRFGCKICGKTFLYPMGLKKHEATHAPTKNYLCRGCGKAFRTACNVQQHETLNCPNLPKKLTSIARKKLKQQDTDRQNENECHQQKEESKDFNFEGTDGNDDIAHSLVEIQLEKSVDGEDSLKTLKPILPSKTKPNTYKRKRKQNEGAKVFHCKEAGCTFECSKTSLYKAHKASVHGGGPGRKRTRKLRKRCQFCYITFDDKDEELLQDHEEKHRASEIPRCVINDCGVEFITLGSLKIHVRKIHVRKIHQQPKTSVTCEVCGKLCSSNRCLNQHRFAMHSGKHRRELKCPDCNYTTFVQTHLDSHQLIHSNERPYLCNQCGATYKRLTELNRHEYMHANVKRFGCKICGKTFLYPMGLKKHEDTHATTKSYLCRGCGKAFRSACNLQQHETYHCSNLPKKVTSITRKKLKKQGIEVPVSTTVDEIKHILNGS